MICPNCGYSTQARDKTVSVRDAIKAANQRFNRRTFSGSRSTPREWRKIIRNVKLLLEKRGSI